MKAGIVGNSKSSNMNDKAKDFRTSLIKFYAYAFWYKSNIQIK